jgi:trans-2,3-dihydro-3-hydroxyanthranilate isomerase
MEGWTQPLLPAGSTVAATLAMGQLSPHEAAEAVAVPQLVAQSVAAAVFTALSAEQAVAQPSALATVAEQAPTLAALTWAPAVQASAFMTAGATALVALAVVDGQQPAPAYAAPAEIKPMRQEMIRAFFIDPIRHTHSANRSTKIGHVKRPLAAGAGGDLAFDPMNRKFYVVDVFTRTPFAGNPLAVVLDTDGLGDASMQQIASEFNFSETIFLFPPSDPRHTARVRIFTPSGEIPFAGHPNIGAAWLLGTLGYFHGQPVGARLQFEEKGGVVDLALLYDNATCSGARLTAPQSLQVGAPFPVESMAACLDLPPAAISLANHEPTVVSVGLPFILIELDSRATLSATRPSYLEFMKYAHRELWEGIHVYVRTPGVDGEPDTLHTRMFWPVDTIREDPATGSANAALAAYLAHLDPAPAGEYHLNIEQGDEIGRPSHMRTRVYKDRYRVGRVELEGACCLTMEGRIRE